MPVVILHAQGVLIHAASWAAAGMYVYIELTLAAQLSPLCSIL